jgi:hypothetical protein
LVKRLQNGVRKLLLDVGQEEECLHKGIEVTRIAHVLQTNWHILDARALVGRNRFGLEAFLESLHHFKIDRGRRLLD